MVGFSGASGADEAAALFPSVAAAPFFIKEMYLLQRSILYPYEQINMFIVKSNKNI